MSLEQFKNISNKNPSKNKESVTKTTQDPEFGIPRTKEQKEEDKKVLKNEVEKLKNQLSEIYINNKKEE